MTDKEIIKALECCDIGENFETCDECPCCIEDESAIDCVKRLHKQAIDLINRQRTENEELQDLMVKYNADFCRQEAEIDV